ncbi:PREDICTED: uncharacterized protein LOC109205676 isoform X1 [Nicotiana attenuata]|uniref:Uncharacterized protein n=1 Tax=Nicotiana attenuata TaxID=49451 RepID=A0A314KWS5_NICAT|nr:PREDICTED: uncharacterized protein LOC109205676 isoform X1 [Nicotiana attenuata]XP_019223960.1 PREDICTED: uncharacterized protein LOC109205676 isoform X1 [Nicotiana attenuata]OIT33692.1 hypothetical protein A4A49_17910 [Nicotiana attenuata]
MSHRNFSLPVIVSSLHIHSLMLPLYSRLPQERMPAKDATQFISPSLGQQRKVIARQIKMLQAMLLRLSKNAAAPVSNLPKMHYFWRSRHTPDYIFGESKQHRTDETSQLENQYLGRERLNRNTEKEVILSVEDSSSYDFGSISEPILGHLTDYASLHQLNEDQLISVDDMESTRIEAQSTLESKSEPSIQSDARSMKLIFEKLIMLPLEALSNLNHEASMKEALTILTGNLSLFADEQAKQLLELKLDFPSATYSWRDCSRTRIDFVKISWLNLRKLSHCWKLQLKRARILRIKIVN